MRLGDFITQNKRECAFGQASLTTDQAELDILARVNMILGVIWAAYDWPWALESISFPVDTQHTQYLVAAASGNLIDRITDLLPQDSSANPPVWGPPLVEKERQDFYAWFASQPAGVGGSNPAIPNTPDIPSSYVNLGLDPNGTGKWLIELAPVPPSSFTMKGFAKKILTQVITPYVIADVTANVVIGSGYFPQGIMDYLLMDGVKAGIYSIMGSKDLAQAYDASFQAKLRMKKSEQANSARDDSGIVTPPPDSYRFKRRLRNRGGTGVY